MKRKSNLVAPETQKKNRKSKQVDGQEIQELRSYFIDLPNCIIFDILLKLPLKWILMCRCVCKSLRTLISDAQFAELHFKHAQVEVLIRTADYKLVARTLHLLDFEPEKFPSGNLTSIDSHFCLSGNYPKPYCKSHMKLVTRFKLPLRDAKLVIDKKIEAIIGGSERRYIACKPEDDKFGVVNSCNGFLCLCDPRDGSPLAICNPVTGEFIKLPNPISLVKEKMQIFSGFGFHPTTNEYKVIRMYKKYAQIPNYGSLLSDDTLAEMHTLGTKIWRTVGRLPNYPSNFKFPTCVNGALHWLLHYMSRNRTILSFNFESERFQSFSCPPTVKNYESNISRKTSMGELRGCLYICDASSSHVKFWVMKEYGVGESWTMFFSVNISNLSPCVGWSDAYLPIKFFENGGILMYRYCSNCLVYCEPGKCGFKCFEFRDIPYVFETISITPSLISLKDVVKGDNVEVLNVHSRCGVFKLREEKQVLFLAKENVRRASFLLSYEEQN